MLEIIKKRRSSRQYEDIMVEDEKIKEVCEAGLYAPTGMNRQDTIIIVIKNKEKRDKLAKINGMLLGRDMDPFYGAPVVLLVLSKKGPLAELDGGAMIQNMLLEATNQGLGSCWIHRAKEELEMEATKELLAPLNLDLSLYQGIDHVILGYSKQEHQEKVIKENRVYYL